MSDFDDQAAAFDQQVAEFPRQARAWYGHLNQSEQWVPATGQPLPIAGMDATWRFNAANWLLKRAKNLAFLYGMGEVLALGDPLGTDLTGQPVHVEAPPEVEADWDREDRERGADPEAWLKTTELYQALVKDLPADAGKHGRHWSDCDLRTSAGTTCSCWKRHAADCEVHRTHNIGRPCHCDHNHPSWLEDH